MKDTSHFNAKLGAACILAALAVTVGWVALHVAVNVYVNALWFDAAGYDAVFWTMFNVRLSIGLLAFAATAAVMWLNAWLAFRAAPLPDNLQFGEVELDPAMTSRLFKAVFGVATMLVALVVGASVAQNWVDFLNFRYAVPFGIEDPVFHHDVSFYAFKLPAAAYLRKLLFFLSLLGIFSALAAYTARGALDFGGEKRIVPGCAFAHLCALGAAAVALFALRFAIARWQLLYSKHGEVFGAGYTDLHARLPACMVLLVAAFAVAAWLLVNAFVRKRPANLAVLTGYVILWIGAGGVWPWAMQNFHVEPNEYQLEQPFVQRNIEFTRLAYGLDQVRVRPSPGDGVLTAAALREFGGTTDNLQIWDPGPLRDMYNQKQRIRAYYEFNDVDIDRYVLDGRMHPVMIAARELNPAALPEQGQVWTNLHLLYTHGYGLCMSYGNRLDPGGVPDFLISNIPSVSDEKLVVEQPRLYYGETTALYALTNTRMDEFDYPGDPENFTNRYGGAGGVSVAGKFRRAMLALFTGDKDIYFTDQFTDESRILLFRQVRERVRKLAPFLHFDEDPYPVLHEGRLHWLIDGYSLTRRFPYSERVGIANYWRNTVKAVVDAYDGTITLYDTGSGDPILQVFKRVFPELFKPLDAMPAGLHGHLRYPRDMFSAQTFLYCRYHMLDTRDFFTKEDVWTFPRASEDGKESFESPRYLVMELPGTAYGTQFVLTRAFTVEGKDNMIAWMAAGCDAGRLGELTVYTYPKSLNIYGPNQAKGRFNQDPEVSAFRTLMGQLGSDVIPSKVLAVPVGDGILYLQSLYVQDPEVKIPDLKQIVVGHGDRVAMAPTIDEALSQLFADQPDAHEEAEQAAAPLESPGARVLYEKARESLRKGDWAEFGEAFDRLGELLNQSE